jgi:hypothetical protein
MTADSEGSWVARSRHAHADKQTYRTLSEFVELPDHQRYTP